MNSFSKRTTKPNQTCVCVCSVCTLCRLCAWWHVFSAVVLALVLHQAGPVTAPYGSYRFNVFLGMMHCNSSHAYYKKKYEHVWKTHCQTIDTIANWSLTSKPSPWKMPMMPGKSRESTLRKGCWTVVGIVSSHLISSYLYIFIISESNHPIILNFNILLMSILYW